MNYRSEFPRFPVSAYASELLTLGFVDQSNHNDSCPSFTSPDNKIRVWIDYPNACDREHKEHFQFGVDFGDFHPESSEWGTADHSEAFEEWDEVLAAIKRGAPAPAPAPAAPTVESVLCTLLETYCASQQLPVMSADELAAEIGNSNPAQYDWLMKFCLLWDASQKILPTAETLAETFSRIMRKGFSADELANGNPETNDAMELAFDTHGVTVNGDDETHCKLWNAALHISKSKGYQS